MKKLYIVLLLSAMVISQCSCFRKFYDTRSATIIGDKELEALKDPNRSIIIHFDEMPMRATHVSIKDSVITADLRYMQGAPGHEVTPSFEVGSHAFKMSQKEKIEGQVHVFLQGQEKPASLKMSVPFSKVEQVQTYAFNRKKTNTSTILSVTAIVVGVAGSVLLVTGAFVALIDSMLIF